MNCCDQFCHTVTYISQWLCVLCASLFPDLVKVGVRADVFYSIADPEKTVLKIDTDEVRCICVIYSISTERFI